MITQITFPTSQAKVFNYAVKNHDCDACQVTSNNVGTLNLACSAWIDNLIQNNYKQELQDNFAHSASTLKRYGSGILLANKTMQTIASHILKMDVYVEWAKIHYGSVDIDSDFPVAMNLVVNGDCPCDSFGNHSSPGD